MTRVTTTLHFGPLRLVQVVETDDDEPAPITVRGEEVRCPGLAKAREAATQLQAVVGGQP